LAESGLLDQEALIPEALPIPERVRQRHRRRKRLSIRQWAGKHLRVVDGPLVPDGMESVPWTDEAFPLQREVITAIDDTRWTKVVLYTPPQAFGKTECAAKPVVLHGIEQRRVNVVYVAASQDLANAQWKDKIKPAMEQDVACNRLLYDNVDLGGNRLHRTFTNGTVLHVLGAESVGNLSGKTAPVIVCDDVQAYPPNLPQFGHPADYAATRTGAYPADQCTIVCIGTAGTVEDWLWRTMGRSAFFCPFVPCLGCGTYQLLEFDRLQFDASDPEAAIAETWMRCANSTCDHPIRFEALHTMLKRHLWVSMPPDQKWVTRPEAGGVVIDPETADIYPHTSRNTNMAGFWSNILYWPWGRTWGQQAAELMSRRGDPDKMKDHQQNYRVVPYEEPKLDADALEPADIEAHAIDGHHWKVVPETAGVHDGQGVVIVTSDVQAGYLWYLVWVWHRPTGTAWLIECGRFGGKIDPKEFPNKQERKKQWKAGIGRSLEKLWSKVSQAWPIIAATGEVVGHAKPAQCLVDCGFEREVVRLACKRFNGGLWRGVWLAVEGSTAAAGSRVPVWPGIAKATIEKKTRRRYWESNTNRAKLYLRTMLAIPPGEPGALNLPHDMPTQPREWFTKQLCAEEWDEAKGKWNKVSGENHLLDCAAEQLAGALCCRVQLHWLDEPSGGDKQAGADVSGPREGVMTDWFKRQKRT